jgi:predicted NACHT family NTPase
MVRNSRLALSAGGLMLAACLSTSVALAENKSEFSEQGFLDAAYNFCATVENREAKSCECERKLMSDPDRLGHDDRVMAFYYWTDKDRFIKEFQSKSAADEKWKDGFALRMSNIQALVIAACGA